MNLITTAEMIEQFGNVKLQFVASHKRYYIFSGMGIWESTIILMLDQTVIEKSYCNKCLTINQFDRIITSNDKNLTQYIKIKVTNDDQNIYQSGLATPKISNNMSKK